MSGILQKVSFNGPRRNSHLTLRVPAWLEAHTRHGAHSGRADRARGLGSVTQGEEVRLPEPSCKESSLKTGGPEGAQSSLFSASCEELRAGVPGSGRAGGLRYLGVQCSPRM